MKIPSSKPDNVGARIKMARRIARLSQQEMADAMGVSKMAISKLERGFIQPSLARLQQLTSITGLRMEFFTRSVSALDIRLADWHKKEE